MIKRNIIATLLMGVALLGWSMTDQQVISFIKQQTAAGKTQQEIGQALLAKGVTPEQAKRIKAQYEANALDDSDESSTNYSRMRASGSSNNENTSSSSKTQAKSTTKSTAKSKSTSKKKTSRSSLKTGSALDNNMLTPMEADSTVNILFDEDFGIFYEEEEEDTTPAIYGHDIFLANELFMPNTNVATPQNYKLGPGDEVLIDIWGANEEHLRQVISPEGSIMIDQLGPVYLNGMTINEAGKYVKSAFSKKYAGMNDEETDIQLTLGEVRSIQVNVLGEVEMPGTFQISPFSSVLNALYLAGGIGDIGSLRNIQVIRNGKKVAGVDIYKLLTEGSMGGNITLQEGDVIIVPPYDQLVTIEGNVKRPMLYEMVPGETIETLVNYAGGYSGNAYSGAVSLSRHTGLENQLFTVERMEFENYPLKDGDVITVGTVLDRYTNRVELSGPVYRPGQYAINSNISTVAELIAAADGLMDNAYTARALLYREGPEMQLQVLALDLGEILSGRAPDIELQKNDQLVISTIEQIEQRGTVTIEGQVDFPGVYPYAENYTLEDLILAAGGLLEGASTARVDIARRIVDPAATVETSQIAEVFSVSIDKTLKKGTGSNFKLKPYDLVHVRLSPGYEEQQTVKIEGEVLFAGDYVLEKRNERVSELVNRAGGILDGAYIKGAYLERELTEAEYEARQETLRIARMQSQSSKDSISLDKIDISKTYNVGIDLQAALDNPGSTYDLVLQQGDRLYVPQLQSTVKIAGDVMFPNAVVYIPGKKLKHYINQAGGYGATAKKNKAFVVYMNGTVALAKRNTVIEPGCQIIVPSKSPNSGVNWGQIMAITSSVTTLAALAATITNIIK